MDKVKKNKLTDKTKENGSESRETVHKPRCINIDCAFNSSLDMTQDRNMCNHPNLKISASSADVTIAICSEFRSKKDYKFKKPNTLIEIKSKDKIEIPLDTEPEIVSAESLVKNVKRKRGRPDEDDERKEPATVSEKYENREDEKPVIIVTGDDSGLIRSPEELSEVYKLTDNKKSNFLILKRLYQPYMKRGVLFSVIFHLILIWLFYLTFVNKENHTEVPPEQRIVIVEDVETPKFIPPDMDKKEEPIDIQEKSEVRPKITPRKITPKIKRPKTFMEDTTGTVHKDTSTTTALDTTLASLNKGDTNRFILPDSLRNSFAENEVGMSLWYPKDWKLRDSRELNKGEQFSGVIINTDSLSEDPGAVTIFILLENDKINSFNKTVFKNPFAMDDTLSTAFATDPVLLGSKKMSYKFYIFAPTNKIYINTEARQEFFEKYRKYIEAIVRSIKILKKEPTKIP